jgi:uncharacterized integral membrane protein
VARATANFHWQSARATLPMATIDLFSNSLHLPLELERIIFEIAALVYPKSIPSLILVARRVKHWYIIIKAWYPTLSLTFAVSNPGSSLYCIVSSWSSSELPVYGRKRSTSPF